MDTTLNHSSDKSILPAFDQPHTCNRSAEQNTSYLGFTSKDVSLSIATIQQLLDQMNQPTPFNKNVHDQLVQIQKDHSTWCLLPVLLGLVSPTTPSSLATPSIAVRLFAAQTLHTKILCDWNSLRLDECEEIKAWVCTFVFNLFNTSMSSGQAHPLGGPGSSAVYNKLAQVFVSLALTAYPDSWKDPLGDLLQWLSEASSVANLSTGTGSSTPFQLWLFDVLAMFPHELEKKIQWSTTTLLSGPKGIPLYNLSHYVQNTTESLYSLMGTKCLVNHPSWYSVISNWVQAFGASSKSKDSNGLVCCLNFTAQNIFQLVQINPSHTHLSNNPPNNHPYIPTNLKEERSKLFMAAMDVLLETAQTTRIEPLLVSRLFKLASSLPSIVNISTTSASPTTTLSTTTIGHAGPIFASGLSTSLYCRATAHFLSVLAEYHPDALFNLVFECDKSLDHRDKVQDENYSKNLVNLALGLTGYKCDPTLFSFWTMLQDTLSSQGLESSPKAQLLFQNLVFLLLQRLDPFYYHLIHKNRQQNKSSSLDHSDSDSDGEHVYETTNRSSKNKNNHDESSPLHQFRAEAIDLICSCWRVLRESLYPILLGHLFGSQSNSSIETGLFFWICIVDELESFHPSIGQLLDNISQFGPDLACQKAAIRVLGIYSPLLYHHQDGEKAIDSIITLLLGALQPSTDTALLLEACKNLNSVIELDKNSIILAKGMAHLRNLLQTPNLAVDVKYALFKLIGKAIGIVENVSVRWNFFTEFISLAESLPEFVLVLIKSTKLIDMPLEYPTTCLPLSNFVSNCPSSQLEDVAVAFGPSSLYLLRPAVDSLLARPIIDVGVDGISFLGTYILLHGQAGILDCLLNQLGSIIQDDDLFECLVRIVEKVTNGTFRHFDAVFRNIPDQSVQEFFRAIVIRIQQGQLGSSLFKGIVRLNIGLLDQATATCFQREWIDKAYGQFGLPLLEAVLYALANHLAPSQYETAGKFMFSISKKYPDTIRQWISSLLGQDWFPNKLVGEDVKDKFVKEIAKCRTLRRYEQIVVEFAQACHQFKLY